MYRRRPAVHDSTRSVEFNHGAVEFGVHVECTDELAVELAVEFRNTKFSDLGRPALG